MYHFNTGLRFWLFLLIQICGFSVAAQVSSESELKKEGDRFFDAQDFENALPDYSRLLSLYPNNNEYMYRFGVCQLMAGKERAGAYAYLEKVSLEPKSPDDVWFYLGKSYLVNNEFSKAKDAFTKFKTAAGASKAKKFDIDNYILNAENGEQLIKSRKNVVIMKSTDVAKSNFYGSYDFTNSPGKIINASEEFYSQFDRSKQKDAVMFMSNDKQTILISSYGLKGENGKDIFIIRRLANGTWSKAQNLGTVNSSKDEDYPFLDRDGKTLYFSSCGHNSMGGYDIFKSVYDFNTGMWSEPENMGIPINSVYDDLLFVPQDNKNAIYSTDVESVNNSISIRNIEIPHGLSEMLTISGEYIPMDQQVRRDARVTALTSDGKGIITTVHTDPVTGKYDLVLAPGQTYLLVVEGGGYVPHAESFELPAGLTDPVLKQVVKLNKDQQKEEMTLENYFASGSVASEPTARFHHSIEANPDTSKMLGITINDEVVYIPAPVAANNENNIQSAASFSEDKSVAVTENLSADPTSKSTIVVKRRETESSGTENTVAGETAVNEVDQSGNDSTSYDADADQVSDSGEYSVSSVINATEETDTVSFSKDITNAELAKIAFQDAREMQAEADSLKQESIALKKSATDLDAYADSLGSSENKDDSVLINRISFLHMQAEKFRSQAVDKDRMIDATEKEAYEALENANQILKASGSQKTASTKNKSENKSPSQKNVAEKKSEQQNAIAVVSDSDLSQPAIEEPVKISNEVNPAAVSENKPATENSSEQTAANENDSLLSSNNKVTEQSPVSDVPVGQKSDATGNNTNPSADNIILTTEPSVNSIAKENTSTSVSEYKNVSAENTDSGNDSISLLKPAGTMPQVNEVASANVIQPEDKNSNESVEVTLEDGRVVSSAQIQAPVMESELVSKENNTELVTGPSNTEKPLESSASSVNKEADDTNTLQTEKVAEMSVAQPESDSSGNPEMQQLAMVEVKKENTAVSNSEPVKTENNNTPAINNTPAASNNSKSDNTQQAGESPRPATAKSFNPDDFPGYTKITVKEEAKVAYRSSQAKLEESNTLSNQSLKIQDKISHLHSSHERDSLIGVSNDMTQHSMEVWHEGLALMEEARKLEPNIDYKMGVIDFASNNGSGDNITTGENHSIAQNTGADKTAQKHEEVLDPQINAKKDTSDENIDTTHPDYPKYAKLQKDVTDKQVETIDVFAQAINLNRMASDETDQANKLLDEAQTENDPDRKAQLVKSADELKQLAATHDAEAKVKFDMAKGDTKDVKALIVQMNVIKDRITIKPGENLASVNKSNEITSKAQGEKLSEGGGLTVVEEPQNKKQDAQSFAMAERANSGMNATDEEISAVSISNEERSNFLNTGFNKIEGSAYSASNPIPMNPSLPEGLVFKIQIGAFHNPLPAETFKGLQPMSGETTRPGWIRYCVGMFRTFEPANLVKNEIKKGGYKDAFVVAYYNGKRIELNDAYTIIRNKENLTAYRSESAKEMAILQNMNIKPVPVSKDKDVLAFYAKQPLPETLRENDSETIKALSEVDKGEDALPVQYTVQLGVFNTATTPEALNKMKPVPPSKVKQGVYRYTTMTYGDRQTADSVKEAAVRSGIADAFVVGVKNGKIVAVNNVSASAVSKKQKWNDAVKDEIPSAEPVYKVQIGAFRNDVPYNIVEAYLVISDKGITTKTDERGLHIFYAGSFKDKSSAAALRQEINAKGIKDAFVVLLQDGKRVAIPAE